MSVVNQINEGRTCLGIELGSTRIKAVMIDENHDPIASGSYDWENRLEDGLWTYGLDDVWKGLQGAYADLKKDVRKQYGTVPTRYAAIGFSAMMHGYLAFDADRNLLVPFRTWRNTNTGRAAAELSSLFQFNIPMRWSISHLYQAMLNHEEHVNHLAHLTTLAGYVHWMLSGENVLGIGDASGMFPIDSVSGNYNEKMMKQFDQLAQDRPWKLRNLLPRVLMAGDEAGRLSEAGAKLLDPSGDLEAGIIMAPPEGDAGTGMAATNSIEPRTGNISAGTSVFAMVVLEKDLEKQYPEIDLVTTPTGAPVAMVHCNNCTSEINAWAGMLNEFQQACGMPSDKGKIYTALFQSAMQADKDCGGNLSYGFLSGEPVAGIEEGRPMYLRLPDAELSFRNFSRAQVFSAIAALKMGMEILEKEHVRTDSLTGHGGFFKTPGTAQNLLASALNTPITAMDTAGEGGAWGMALLAAYESHHGNLSLNEYLQKQVFAHTARTTAEPDAQDHEGFNAYMEHFRSALTAEKAAAESFK